jgi:polygalacturonase
MSIARRDFLRTGMAAAALAASGSGCEQLSVHSPPDPGGGWSQLPEILAKIVPPRFPARDFVVTDYGARSDGRTDCAPAFAEAIMACSKAGGGRVVVPSSRHIYILNGPIHLLSNVNLYLEQGAEIQFGTEPSYYLPVVLVRYQGIRCYNYSPLIYAYQQTNIAITGSGTFDGQAYYWNSWENLANPDWALLQQMVAQGVPVENRVFGAGHHLRLTMFEPYECTNILVQGVTFRGSPFWTLHPTFCTNVSIQNVTVERGQSNDDGCDPDSCSYVLVEDCTFDTNDDNVSIKGGFGPDAQDLPPCESIVFQNCRTVKTDWGGITIGSDTGGGVQNVFVQNCTIGKCNNAFYIKSSSAGGGAAQNIYVRNCQVTECNIFLDLNSDYAGNYGPNPPLFLNLNFTGINCDTCNGIAFLIAGDSRRPIVTVILSDIAIGSAAKVQQISNALFIEYSDVTIDGKAVTVRGLL